MKTMILGGLLAVLAPAASAASAAAAPSEVREAGLGVVLGSPTGVTAKLWLDDRLAVDLGVGLVDGDGGLWGDLLWHDWTLLPQPSNGKLGLYLGGGPQLRGGDDSRFGVRAIAGISYRPTGHPLELYAEAGPLFQLTDEAGVDGVIGVGLRMMLGGSGK